MQLIEIKIPKDWKPYAKLLDDSIKNEKGVYLLFDKEFKLLYVGKTRTLRLRLVQHVSPNNINRGLRYGSNSYLPFGVIKYYAFIKIENDELRNITENVLTNTAKPSKNSRKYDKDI